MSRFDSPFRVFILAIFSALFVGCRFTRPMGSVYSLELNSCSTSLCEEPPSPSFEIQVETLRVFSPGDYVVVDLYVEKGSTAREVELLWDPGHLEPIQFRFNQGINGRVEFDGYLVVLEDSEPRHKKQWVGSWTLRVTDFSDSKSGAIFARSGVERFATADLDFRVLERRLPPWVTAHRDLRTRGWMAADVAQFMLEDSDYPVDLGIWTARPAGNSQWLAIGSIVQETKSILRAQGVDFGTALVHHRPDVFAKLPDDNFTCRPNCSWEGVFDEPFKDEWKAAVPFRRHLETFTANWGTDLKKDPATFCSGAECWPSWVDRQALFAGIPEGFLPALYVSLPGKTVQAAETTYPQAVGVVMDMRNPEYRQWAAKHALAMLQNMALDPEDRLFISLTYKPGWHTFYENTGDNEDPCWLPGSNVWTGPAHLCMINELGEVTYAPGGPLENTTYLRGEYEFAVNAYVFELRAALLRAGYNRVLLGTEERPRYGLTNWTILYPHTTRQDFMAGERFD